MPKKQSFLILCCILVLISACVTEKKYLALEADHLKAQDQLDHLQRSMKETEFKLQDSEESQLECFKELSGLQGRYDELEDRNVDLARDAEELKMGLAKRKSTIQHQKRVIQQLDETRSKIETNLKGEIAKQTIKIEEIEGKLKVTFVDKILFDAGRVKIKDRGRELLLEIANSLREDESQNIWVEGHTDNVSIGGVLKERFPSNWELSAARAAAVVRLLQEETGLDPKRLSATGYSYYRPVEPNDTAEGRRQNRRIEIILVPVR